MDANLGVVNGDGHQVTYIFAVTIQTIGAHVFRVYDGCFSLRLGSL